MTFGLIALAGAIGGPILGVICAVEAYRDRLPRILIALIVGMLVCTSTWRATNFIAETIMHSEVLP